MCEILTVWYFYLEMTVEQKRDKRREKKDKEKTEKEPVSVKILILDS